jgi:hypothetical protein
MALNPAALKAAMKQSVYNGLKSNFSAAAAKGQGYPAISDAQWMMIADAVSDIAKDIVMEITTNATVLPGIPTAGGPSNQVTVGPGKIS